MLLFFEMGQKEKKLLPSLREYVNSNETNLVESARKKICFKLKIAHEYIIYYIMFMLLFYKIRQKEKNCRRNMSPQTKLIWRRESKKIFVLYRKLLMNICIYQKEKIILPSSRKYVTSNETNQEKRRKSRKGK